MLGGSVVIALIRFAISLAGVIILGSLTVEYEKKCVKALKKGFFFCQIFCVYVCYFMLLYAIIRHRKNAHESSYHKIKKCGIVLHGKVLCQIRRRYFIKNHP